jgi:hypothetical protein
MFVDAENALLRQGPMGSIPQSAFVSPPEALQDWKPAARDRAPIRRSRAFAAGAFTTALFGVLGAVVWALHGSHGATPHGAFGGSSQAASPGGAQSTGASGPVIATAAIPPAAPGAAQSLLTPAGVRAAIRALRGVIGEGNFKELYVSAAFVTAQAPTRTNQSVYDNYVYRGGVASDESAGSTLSADDVLFDPGAINWGALPALLSTADSQLGIAHPTSRYVVATGDVAGTDPALLVFTADRYGSAYLLADARGNIIRKFPRT